MDTMMEAEIDIKPNRRRELLAVDPTQFWHRIKKPDGCWLFDGAKEINGYGYVKNPLGAGPKFLTAHRLAWILTHGPIPDGLRVLHRCDIRACVNPAHLFLGTDTDNTTDKLLKARHGGKLSPEDIREIRAAFAGVTDRRAIGALQKELAEKYNTVPRWIWAIRTGRKWKSVA